MAEKLTFYYLGDDEAYLKNLQGAFKQYSKDSIEFHRFFETDEAKIQSLFVKIYKDKPTCVFLDFSQETQDYLHIARLISRTPIDSKILMVGLIDYLSPKATMKESTSTGVNLTFVKSTEAYDVVFDVLTLLQPAQKREHEFASAPLKETWAAGISCKVGYIHEKGLHIETDYVLNQGDKLNFHHDWIEQGIVPSEQMVVKGLSKKNLFYQFASNADLEFRYVDEYLAPEGTDEDVIFQKREERSEAVGVAKAKLADWIERNQSKSLEKKARVLIIDQEFAFYKDQKRTDKHPYTIRCIADFTMLQDQLNRIDPQVIAIAVTADNKNNLKVLASNLKKTHGDHLPFLVLFNVPENSKEYQTLLEYPALMATENEIAVDVLVKMAEIFEKKMILAHQINATDSSKVFIKKTHDASFGEIMIDLEVTKISETDLFFKTHLDLESGMNLHLKFPVDMYVNVQLLKKDPKGNEYHGLIHCLGELEKKELRKFVNSVFFREHDATLQTQTDEFKKLNEKKLQEKLAEEEKLEKARLEAEEKKSAS
jgi:hypothetical protein